MDLHHQPVVQAHARHLDQHRRAEQLGVGSREIAADVTRANSRSRFARSTGRRSRRSDGRDRSTSRPPAANAARRLRCAFEIAAPGVHVFVRSARRSAPATRRNASCSGSIDRIGTIGRDHAAAPAAARESRDAASSVSTGDSVVASTSMLKRSNSARGRNSSCVQLLADDVEVVVGGVGFESAPSVRTPSRTRSSATAHEGVPRNR